MFDSALQKNMQQWFETALGQYVLEQELHYFDRAVADIFGYNAAQIGWTEFDLLRNNRIPFKCVLGLGDKVSASVLPAFLPIKSDSLDLILLPHTLEFNSYPIQILREAHRVLIDDGKVIISGFNPFSFWGAYQRITEFKRDFPWCGHFIDLSRVKDWLALLDFEIVAGQFGCYAPPCSTEKWLSRFHFMEVAGDRWWPIAGGVYFLQAVKREYGMRIIKPCWEDAAARKRKVASVPQTELGRD